MDPDNIPFNALIVGPTNSGKTRYLINQLRGPFRGEFDYIVLICPTFVHNKTYDGFVDNEPRIFVIDSVHHEVEIWLKIASLFFEGTNILIILDDCAASKDVKGRTSQLVNLGFSARHNGISVWVLTQQFTSIAKPFRENVMAIVLFYTPSRTTIKAIFDEYAGDLSSEEQKNLIARLKQNMFSCLVFSLKPPYGIELKYNLKNNYLLTMDASDTAIAQKAPTTKFLSIDGFLQYLRMNQQILTQESTQEPVRKLIGINKEK